MKKLFKTAVTFIIAITVYSCAEDLYTVPDDLVVHDFVWKGLNAYYLHQDEILDLSDRRFTSDIELERYLNGFSTYNELFSNLTLSTDVKSALLEDYTNLDVIPLRTGFTNGLEFGIIVEPGSTDNVIGFVSHILSNSDASTKNILRGEFFNAVDGEQLTRNNFESLLISGSDIFDLNMIDFDGVTVTPNMKIVSLEKLTYNYPATYIEKVISYGTNNIGYLMYNNDFSSNYLNDLNTTFLNFKNEDVNELVLDLRYNIGGGSFVRDLSKIATMITGQFPDEILLKEEWNVKAQPWFLANQPDSLLTKFPTKMNLTTDINSLNLTDVYIVLNGTSYTGSSSTELLINSLKPYINVHVIGTQTSGNNTGAITLYNSQDYDFPLRNETHTVALQPIVLSFLNNNDETYENGFTANITLCPNEDVLNLGILGDVTDPILDRIINFINTGTAGTNPVCNPNNFEFLYNSINTQRQNDNSVFIRQNLPNTYQGENFN
jgi:hypothetical protein